MDEILIDHYVNIVKTIFIEMSDEQRIEFVDNIMYDYCKHCGALDLERCHCQCWNDE